jgi:hypothetical protein
MGLFDMVMIKDNHIAAAGGIEAAVEGARDYLCQNNLDMGVEVGAPFLGVWPDLLSLPLFPLVISSRGFVPL